MIVRCEGRTWCGSVADLRDTTIDGPAAVAALRGEDAPCDIHAAGPGPLFERVGHVHREMGLRVRTALAEAARSRGMRTPQDAALERARKKRERLAAETTRQRRTQAPTGDRQERRERVAELRGRVQALEACGQDASEARAKHRDAAGHLSEIETARFAAEEYREQTRPDRDRRDEKMHLEDRIANLERDVRSRLVERLREPYERTVFALDPSADPFDCDPVTAALAILRLASVSGPVVLETGVFPTPAAAADWIGAPIVYCGE